MKKCTECGEDFEPKNPKGVFCSQRCRQKDYRKKVANWVKLAKEGGVEALIEWSEEDHKKAKKGALKDFKKIDIPQPAKTQEEPNNKVKDEMQAMLEESLKKFTKK